MISVVGYSKAQKVVVENFIGIMNSDSFLYEMNKPIFIYDLYIINIPDASPTKHNFVLVRTKRTFQ